MDAIEGCDAVIDQTEFLDRMDGEQSQSVCNGRLFTHGGLSPAIAFSHGITETCGRDLKTRMMCIEKYNPLGSRLEMFICHETSQSVEVSGSVSIDRDGNTSAAAGAGYSVSSSDDNGNNYSLGVTGSVSTDNQGNANGSVTVSGKVGF